MSEEGFNVDTKPKYLGERKLDIVLCTYVFTKRADKFLKKDYGLAVGQELAERIAKPGAQEAFHDYIKDHPDFKIKGQGNQEYTVDTRKSASSRVMLIDHDRLEQNNGDLEERTEEAAARRRDFV